MMRAILVAAGLLALCGTARADWRDTVDELYPDCRHTPIAQMTRERLEFCDTVEHMIRGMDENLAKARAAAAAEAQSQQPAKRAECHETADIICEHWPSEAAAPKPAGRRGH
jgi:hypothetical protein